MSTKRAGCWRLAWLAALGGSACGDSSDGERAAESSANASLPSSPPGNAGGGMTPTMVMQSASAPMSGAAGSGPASGMAEAPGMTASAPAGGMPGASTASPAGAAAPSFPGETCDGCVRFFLPMTGENQRGDFERTLAAPLDLTGATIQFRLLANGFGGNAGGVSVYVRDAGNFDKGFVWTNLTSLVTWTEVVMDFATMLPGNEAFDVTKVTKIGVQLNSAGTFAGANWQSATLYLDSVRFANAAASDLGFSDGIGDFSLVSPDAPAGASVGFIAL